MKKIKRIFSETKKKYMAILMLMICTLPQNAYAADLDPTAAVTKLYTLITSIISAGGGIFLIYSIVQFGIAHKRQDAGSKADATNGMIGGLIICGAPWIVKFLIGN